MVFGLCANRFIAYATGFIKDVLDSNKTVQVARRVDQNVTSAEKVSKANGRNET